MDDGFDVVSFGKLAGLVYKPAPCPQCGAQNADQANNLCRQTQDETGEYHCAGEFDEDGISVQPTPESIAAMNAWIDAEVAKDEAEMKRRALGQSMPKEE